MLQVTQDCHGLTFGVKVVPRAHRNEITGLHGGALKVRLTAPPVEGKANQALLHFLAERLGLTQEQVEIVAGHRGRQKSIRVSGLTMEELRHRLWPEG